MGKPERIILRQDIADNWTTANPVLGLGEVGFEIDTLRMKVGDDVSAWTALDYFNSTLPMPVPIHIKTAMPDATLYTGSWIYVSNDVGGAVMAFSDGSDWLRCTDRAAIS